MDKNYIVSKSNVLINSSYDLSLEEQRIILTLASMVQPEDKDFKVYKFKISDFMKLLNVKSKTKYSDIPKITKELMQKVFEIKQDKRILQLAWLSSADYVEGTGVVELEFSPKLKPFMLGLKSFYTSYKLENILELKSKYSIRVYELLKSNEFKKVIEITIDDLREMLKAQTNSYKIYQNFKNRIIIQSQKELNEKTDIRFQFEEIKTGRKVTSIKFFIEKNKKNISKSNIDAQQEIAATSIIEPIEQLEGQVKVDDILESVQDEEYHFPEDFTYKELDPVKQVQKIFKSYKITEHEAKCILNDANNDIELIKECCNYIQDKDIKNVVGYIRSLVKNYIEPKKNIGKGTYKKNSFNDYEQRSYDFDELERKLLGWDKD